MIRHWLGWSKQGLLLRLCWVAPVAVLARLLELRSPESSFKHQPLFLGVLTWLCDGRVPPGPCWLCRDWATDSLAVRPLPSVCCPFAVLPRTFVASGGDTLGTSSQRSSSPTVACSFAFVQTLSFNESDLSPERETKQDSIWAVSSSR